MSRDDAQINVAMDKLYLNDVKLEFVTQYRYLGVKLDHHLKMDKHVDKIIGKVRPFLYMLAKLRHRIWSEPG